MDQHNSIRSVHIERLSLLFFLGITPGRVAHVAQANGSHERAHVAGAVTLAHLTLGLVDMQRVFIGGRNTGGVLASVLKKG